VVVAEGAKPRGGELTVAQQELGREVRLGGIAERVANMITETTGVETRTLVLGHLQRGGSPTPLDRILALRFGCAAVRLAEEGKWNHMVAWQPPHMNPVPIAEAVKLKSVPLDHDAIVAARDLGICLGD
jgi:6-phosphofructokinase 1